MASLDRRTQPRKRGVLFAWLLEQAPHNPVERIRWLRDEAAALLGEARAMELLLPHPPPHACPPLCEFCLIKALGNKP